MLQVPYSPNVNYDAHTPGIAPIHIDTPADAFGASLGRALGQEGAVTSEASNEVFTRAMTMQQLTNEADSRNAQAQYIQKQGDLHAQFTALQGAQAGPDALNNYMKSSNDLRMQMRDSLTSPAAQKMFDADSMSFMSRNIFNAAGHSAQQMKGYALATSKAVLDNNANAALQNPDDELQFKASLANQRTIAAQHAQDQGFAPGTPESDAMVNREVSNLVSSRILGAARTNPAQANAWFQGALKDGTLRGQDIARVQNTIQSQTLAMLPKQINDGINDGSSLVLGKGIVDPSLAREGIKAAEGGDYSVQGPTVAKGQYAGERALGAYQVMPGNLPGWLRDAGMPPMTPEQFLASPKAQDQLFDAKFGAMMKQYGSFNRAASAWFTGNPDAPATANDGYHTAPEYLAKANAGIAKASPIGMRVDAARSEATRLGANTPGIEDAAESRVIATDRQDHYVQQQQTAAIWNTINGAIVNSQGHTPGTIEQLAQQSPEAAQAISGLNQKDTLKLQRTLQLAQSHDNVVTQERTDRMHNIIGTMSEDPAKFQAVDPMKEDLRADDRKTIISLQQKQLKGGAEDPNVNRAIVNLGQELRSAGLQGDGADKDAMTTFRGALTESMQDFQKEKARPPSIEEIQTIGRRLLQNQVVGKTWYGGNAEAPTYSAKPSDDQAAAIRRHAPPGTDLTDAQVQRVFTRMLYNQTVKKERNG